MNSPVKIPFSRAFLKLGLDLISFICAFSISYSFRFSLQTFFDSLDKLQYFILIYIAVRIATFLVFKMYSSIWRFTGIHTLVSLLKATSVGTIVILVVGFFTSITLVPRSVFIMDWLLVIFFSGGIRIFTRILYTYNWDFLKRRSDPIKKMVLIYGAGQAGELLLRNIENDRSSNIWIEGFIDDDPNKRGKYIHGKPILCDGTNIGEIVKKHNIGGIYLSIPSLSGLEIRQILKSIMSQVDDSVEIKTIPGLVDLMKDKFKITQLRKFEIKDLLRRKPIELDYIPVKELLLNKNVLVVGGGGSIGSELCYQIASFNPANIIILDNTEFNCYRTEGLLRKENFTANIATIVADACNEKMLRKVFEYYEPEIVFHAAAYKHVPMMEMTPWAAVYNNLKCTLNLVNISQEFHVERFILISTDKAVQPTSVMGTTKKICEQIVQHSNHSGDMKFMTVRFGNVLGSSGSVIPKFQEQIESGGPVTITHPEINRYFMLISEAVELVLQAAAIGKSGNIYVLDMGEPIKILDLAKYMIELSGLKLDEDIKIEFTGLRPGEKISESLYFKGEEQLTGVPNLFVLTPKYSLSNNYIDLVEDLIENVYKMDHSELRDFLKKIVPEYSPYIPEHIQLPFTDPQKIISVNFRSA